MTTNIETVRDRSTYIGGSDIAAVMGLSKWMTPLELWEYKTGRKVKEIDPVKERILRRGTKLEPFIREMTIEKLNDMGLAVTLTAVNERHSAFKPYFGAEIDFELCIAGETTINGELVTFDGEYINADAKSVSGFARKNWGEIGTDEVPIEYAAQFMWGLGLTERQWCLVAALRSFDDVDLFWVKNDPETIVAMQAKATQFWEQHVLKGVPPDPVNFADVKHLYAKANPLADMLATDDESLVQKVYNYKRISAAIKDLEGEKETLQFEITKAIGDAPGLSHAGKPLCTWNNEKWSRFDVTGFKEKHPELCAQFTNSGTHRVLRVKVK